MVGQHRYTSNVKGEAVSRPWRLPDRGMLAPGRKERRGVAPPQDVGPRRAYSAFHLGRLLQFMLQFLEGRVQVPRGLIEGGVIEDEAGEVDPGGITGEVPQGTEEGRRAGALSMIETKASILPKTKGLPVPRFRR